MFENPNVHGGHSCGAAVANDGPTVSAAVVLPLLAAALVIFGGGDVSL